MTQKPPAELEALGLLEDAIRTAQAELLEARLAHRQAVARYKAAAVREEELVAYARRRPAVLEEAPSSPGEYPARLDLTRQALEMRRAFVKLIHARRPKP